MPAALLEYHRGWSGALGLIPANRPDMWTVFYDYYLNCIRDNDRALQLVIDALDEMDLWKDTVVVFSADHGEMAGVHGGLKGKGPFCYEANAHVPLVIAHPEGKPGTKCSALTSHLDLLPTFVGLTGLPESRASGRSGLAARARLFGAVGRSRAGGPARRSARGAVQLRGHRHDRRQLPAAGPDQRVPQAARAAAIGHQARQAGVHLVCIRREIQVRTLLRARCLQRAANDGRDLRAQRRAIVRSGQRPRRNAQSCARSPGERSDDSADEPRCSTSASRRKSARTTAASCRRSCGQRMHRSALATRIDDVAARPMPSAGTGPTRVHNHCGW